MVNEIRTYPTGWNKGFSSKFCVGSWFRLSTSEEGQRVYQTKRCENNNEAEDNISNILNDKNSSSSSSQKFRQIIFATTIELWQQYSRKINYQGTNLTPLMSSPQVGDMKMITWSQGSFLSCTTWLARLSLSFGALSAPKRSVDVTKHFLRAMYGSRFMCGSAL